MTESLRIPSRQIPVEQGARAVAERQELAERRHTCGEQFASADRDDRDDRDPSDYGRRAGSFAPGPPGAPLGVGTSVARSHVCSQSSAAAELQADDLTVGHQTPRSDGPTADDHRRRSGNDADERTYAGDGAGALTAHHTDDELGERDQHHLNAEQRKPPGTGQRGHGAHPVSCAEHVVAKIGPALFERLEVPGASRGNDQHSRALVMGAPTEVDVLAVERDVGIEPAEGAEQIGTHQQACRWEGEDVTNGIVLFLIGLTRVDERIDLAEPVDRIANVLQHVGIVPFDQLRPDDPGVRAIHLLDEQADRVGLERHVIVQEAEEAVVAIDQAEDLVRRAPESIATVDRAYEGPRHHGRHLDGNVGRITRDQDEGLEVGVVLARETGEHLVEPRTAGDAVEHLWFMDHHHGHDGRGERAGGFHDHARLAARPSHHRSVDSVGATACNS